MPSWNRLAGAILAGAGTIAWVPSAMQRLELDRIVAAAGGAAPYVLRTPVVDLVTGRRLQLECLQPTGSYKVRGFFATALALPPEKLARGLLTVSAGNAELAAAYVSHTLGVNCRVVM